MNLFKKTLKGENDSGIPPVWFMRQAGRYHRHYQNLKKSNTFEELCKNPDLAAETTFGPIEDFDFDAAILFSDLLFPLEAMGTGLKYAPGPQLDRHLKSLKDLEWLKGGRELASFMNFQKEAMVKIRAGLSADKGLIGFVGSPWTLFCYAVEGSHKGNLSESKTGLRDGRWERFCELNLPMMIANMSLQAEGGPDAIAIFDTCAGDLSPGDYAEFVVPVLEKQMAGFKKSHPDVALIYYSKNTSHEHWQHLIDLPIDVLGVDWKTPLREVIEKWGDRWGIQGNIDPNLLLGNWPNLEKETLTMFESVEDLDRSGWIFGLGHGVLPKVPEENVRKLVLLARSYWG